MSLPCPFPFWVVAEQNATRSAGYCIISLAVLNLAELNLHPRPCPRYSLFALNGALSSNQPTVFYVYYVLYKIFVNVFVFIFNASKGSLCDL